MSGRRIRATVQADAEVMAIVQQLRAARHNLREDLVRRAVGAGSARAVALRQILVREAADLPELRVRPVEAEADVAQLERMVDDAVDARQLQAHTLERLTRALPDGVAVDGRTLRRDPDGALRFTARTARGGSVEMILGRGAGGDGLPLAFDVARAGFDRVRSAAGVLTGCEAEVEAIAQLATHLRDRGVDVQVVQDGPAAPAQRAVRREAAG
jgi:hypothetical protein